jgi:cytochrome c
MWTVGGALVLCAISAASAQRVAASQQGAVLFENRCARCHGVNADGDEGLAPSLIGVVGRSLAAEENYRYSDALKAKSGIWDAEMLDHYLANPQAFAPGTEMDVNSPDPAERAAVIAYLKTLR